MFWRANTLPPPLSADVIKMAPSRAKRRSPRKRTRTVLALASFYLNLRRKVRHFTMLGLTSRPSSMTGDRTEVSKSVIEEPSQAAASCTLVAQSWCTVRLLGYPLAAVYCTCTATGTRQRTSPGVSEHGIGVMHGAFVLH